MSKIIVAKAMATRKCAYCQEPSKIILPLTAQKISVIKTDTDKNSCRKFTRFSAWFAPKAH